MGLISGILMGLITGIALMAGWSCMMKCRSNKRIAKALGIRMPYFAHVSLILAPDRSKLSKRHGATSVGQFKEIGYLPQAMVNYPALLGWGDGTENEFFTLEQLVEKFSIERVNKSGAVFESQGEMERCKDTVCERKKALDKEKDHF